MSNTVFRRAVNGMFRIFGDKRTQNVFSTVASKSNLFRSPTSDGFAATRNVSNHLRSEPREIVGAGRIFRAVRGMTAINSAALKPLVTPLTSTFARYSLLQPAVAVDGPVGTVGGTRTQNVFSTVTAKCNLHRPPAASDGFVATRSASDLARPEPQETRSVGRVFRTVRGVTAFNCEPKPSAAAPSKGSAARHVPPRPSVAINGFGRIGKCLLRLAVKNNVNIVAINEPFVDLKSMAHSFREDSVHGKFRGQVEVEEDNLCVNGKLIKVYHEENPEKIKWGEMQVDYVIDSSGKFTDIAAATKHISSGGAKKVIIAAPSKDAPTFFKGVNYSDYKKTMAVVSTSSSTANCAASLLHAMNEKFHVVSYMVSSAPIMMPGRFFLNATNYVEPGSGNVAVSGMPELHNTSEGLCFLKFYMSLKTNANPNDIKCLVWEMATCSDDNAVSYRQDLGNFVFSAKYSISRYSAVVDFNYVHVDGKHVTVAAWYDNATGRAARALDLVEHMTRVDHCQE